MGRDVTQLHNVISVRETLRDEINNASKDASNAREVLRKEVDKVGDAVEAAKVRLDDGLDKGLKEVSKTVRIRTRTPSENHNKWCACASIAQPGKLQALLAATRKLTISISHCLPP